MVYRNFDWLSITTLTGIFFYFFMTTHRSTRKSTRESSARNGSVSNTSDAVSAVIDVVVEDTSEVEFAACSGDEDDLHGPCNLHGIKEDPDPRCVCVFFVT